MTLVLLPGMDGTGRLFAPLIAALEGEFDLRVARYPNSETGGYEELEAIASAFIPETGPYVLLGESFSGPIAARLAASASTQLKGLILCCSFVSNPRPKLAMLKFLLPWLPITTLLTPLLLHLLLGRFSSRALRAALAQALEQIPQATLRARLAAVLAVDASSALARVRVPLLYLRASSDRLVSPSASALVSKLKPDTTIVDFVAPHFLLQSVPQEAAQAIAAFVRPLHQAI
jgi:pimeloyl-ACP methyl ester carboxylesterase